MSKDRAAAFTDALLAIVMTILVLELEHPAEPTISAFLSLWRVYFAYALSFFWLGSMWVNMHREWDEAKYVNTIVLWRLVVLLFFASLMPYATSIVSDYFDDSVAQCFYGIVVIAITLANIWLSKGLGKANRNVKQLNRNRMERRQHILIGDVGIKAAGFLIAAFIWPPAMMIAVLVAALYTTISINLQSLRVEKKN